MSRLHNDTSNPTLALAAAGASLTLFLQGAFPYGCAPREQTRDETVEVGEAPVAKTPKSAFKASASPVADAANTTTVAIEAEDSSDPVATDVDKKNCTVTLWMTLDSPLTIDFKNRRTTYEALGQETDITPFSAYTGIAQKNYLRDVAVNNDLPPSCIKGTGL